MLKRSIDIITSFLLLLLCLPVFGLTFISIRIKFGKPILFCQFRPGIHGKPFRMIKFRTLIDEFDSNGKELTHSERLTNLGKFLRSTSIDELPQLWNVLKGDMSLVGPRPLMTEYLPLYNSHQARRHEIKPGLTGWAQIKGRNAISWEEKFELDIWYVNNKSFFLDIKILLITLRNVILRQNINNSEKTNMPRFKGS